MRSLVRRNAHSSLLVSPPQHQFQPSSVRDVVYTTCPNLEPSNRLTSRPVASLQNLFLDYSSIPHTASLMDLKGGVGMKTDKKRGPVTALLSRQNSKTGRGSTPVSNSDQDSPPIVADNSDNPLNRANNGGMSRTSSIRSKQGEPSAERNISPSPNSRDQTPSRDESGQGDDLSSKVTGKRLVDSAKKKILWLASKSEWGSLEQAMKALEQTIAAQKNSTSESSLPLAGIQDDVRQACFSFYSSST